MSHIVRPATVDDARYIAKHLRDEDRREIDALTALSPEAVLPQLVNDAAKPLCFTTVKGKPVGVFGVQPTPIPILGTVWCVTTNAILHHKMEFLRASRVHVEHLNEDFPLITNVVDARNSLHINWLRWLGFKFLRRIDRWGARSVPFIEFARIKQCV